MTEQSLKKSYYEIQLDALNSIERLTDKKKYVKTIDFSKLIEKDSDAQIIKEIKVFDEFLKEGILKETTESKKEIVQPKPGKLITNFAYEVAGVLKNKFLVFYRPDSKDIVEVGDITISEQKQEIYRGFLSVSANRFITLIERYAIPGIEIWNEKLSQHVFFPKSISSQLSTTVLASHILQDSLPQINRIFTVPIPIMHDGKLTFPKRGYDKRFNSWMPFQAPEIINKEMSIEEAKEIIKNLFKEFCFQSKQDYINAVAGLLTPFLRGMFSRFNIRTPVFFYIANRERAGKDYCAGITGITYEGTALEESPISTSENVRSNNTDELRKKVLASMITGKKRLHFANNKGFINNASFEMIVTAERYSDRILGRNEVLTFDNELDFSLSGNTGIGYTPDFANRCRFVHLFLDIEDANTRDFDNPDLHGWVKENRGIVLSALYSLVRNWVDNGMKDGSVKFASFPEWAKVCGGIMESAGYESPCVTDKNSVGVAGDTETNEMKTLFEICYEKCANQWLTKKEIKELILKDDNDIFSYLNLENKSDQTQFGKKIMKFVGRVLSDIRMIVKDPSVRSARQQYKFTKEKVETEKNIFDTEELTEEKKPTQKELFEFYKAQGFSEEELKSMLKEVQTE